MVLFFAQSGNAHAFPHTPTRVYVLSHTYAHTGTDGYELHEEMNCLDDIGEPLFLRRQSSFWRTPMQEEHCM